MRWRDSLLDYARRSGGLVECEVMNIATCIITNCRKRAPADEPFCADHRRKNRTMTNAIHPAPVEFTAEQISADAVLRYFQYSHLPTVLQGASKPFCDLARHIVETLPRNAERSVALRKLLEAKDAAVRANVSKD